MGYDTAEKTDVNSVVPDEWGGMWFLKEELSADTLGFTILELEPGRKGKEHDETTTGQVEIYYVVSGKIDIKLTNEIVTLSQDEAIRLDPQERRQILNNGEKYAKIVLVGAPL